MSFMVADNPALQRRPKVIKAEAPDDYMAVAHAAWEADGRPDPVVWWPEYRQRIEVKE